MMERHAAGDNVEVEEFRSGEFCWAWVGGLENGPLVGFHGFRGEAEGGRGDIVLVGTHGIGDVHANELTSGSNVRGK